MERLFFVVLRLSWSLDSSQNSLFFSRCDGLLLHLVKFCDFARNSDRLSGLVHATFLLSLVGVYLCCVLGLLWLCNSRRRIWERVCVHECVSVCVWAMCHRVKESFSKCVSVCVAMMRKHFGTFCSDGPCVLKPATKKYALKNETRALNLISLSFNEFLCLFVCLKAALCTS